MVRLRLSTEQRIASFIPAIIRVSMLEVFDSYAGLWRKEKGNMIEKIKELKDIGGGGGVLSYSASTGRPLKKSVATCSNSFVKRSLAEFWWRASIEIRIITLEFRENILQTSRQAFFLLKNAALSVEYS
jgi:hypothetical protein